MKDTPRDGAAGRNTTQWKGSCISKWNQQIKDEGINKNKGIGKQRKDEHGEEHRKRNHMKKGYYGREINKWVIDEAYKRGVIKETRHLLSFNL